MDNFIFTIAAALIVVWSIGFLGYNMGPILPILQILAVIAILLKLIRGEEKEVV